MRVGPCALRHGALPPKPSAARRQRAAAHLAPLGAATTPKGAKRAGVTIVNAPDGSITFTFDEPEETAEAALAEAASADPLGPSLEASAACEEAGVPQYSAASRTAGIVSTSSPAEGPEAYVRRAAAGRRSRPSPQSGSVPSGWSWPQDQAPAAALLSSQNGASSSSQNGASSSSQNGASGSVRPPTDTTRDSQTAGTEAISSNGAAAPPGSLNGARSGPEAAPPAPLNGGQLAPAAAQAAQTRNGAKPASPLPLANSVSLPAGAGQSAGANLQNGHPGAASLPLPENGSVPAAGWAVQAVEGHNTGQLVSLYAKLSADGRVQDAIQLLEAAAQAGRKDVFRGLRYKDFMKAAARQGAVPQATRFVQLLQDNVPPHQADARVYNMLVSVCVAAQNVPAALAAGDMLRSTGRSWDAILYTNLITACASVADTETAFKLYGELRADGVRTDCQVYTALITACSRRIQGSAGHISRRDQLVLLEQATQVFKDMQAARVRPDATAWNSLIASAGRAGNLQRAQEVLEDMMRDGVLASEGTYAVLINACAQSGEQALALKIYRRALENGCTNNLRVYSAAMAACSLNRAGWLDGQQIFADMQSHGVPADHQMYSMLISKAGKAKDVDSALALHQQMLDSHLQPTQATYSTLLEACVLNNRKEMAEQVYQEMRSRGLCPDSYARSALISMYGATSEFWKAVQQVTDMVQSGQQPDRFTYAAILWACHRCGEAALACEVYRVMQHRHVPLEEAHCFPMLRICYNQQRLKWVPGGYPPKAGSTPRIAEELGPAGLRLLQALTGDPAPELHEHIEDIDWPSRAVHIYRSFLAQGHPLRMHVLNQALNCLRLPFNPEAEAWQRRARAAKVSGGHAKFQVPSQDMWEHDNSRVFDDRAVSLVEEAISKEVLPKFRLDRPCVVDLKSLPPTVASAYVVTVLDALESSCAGNIPHSKSPGFQNKKVHAITFLVPPYDKAQIFFPSYARFEAEHRGPGQQSVAADDDEDLHNPAMTFQSLEELPEPSEAAAAQEQEDAEHKVTEADKTALGVAGVLRRVRLWAEEDNIQGSLTLLPRRLRGWMRTRQRHRFSSSDESPFYEQAWLGGSIAAQQQAVRAGQGGHSTRTPRGQTGRRPQH